MQQEQQEASFGQQLNVVVGLAHFFCWPVYPWLRRFATWGSRFAGLPAIIGTFIVMPLTIAEIDGNGRVAYWAFVSTCFMCFIHRITGLFRRSKEHSQYSGRPWIGGNEWHAKGVKEPLFLLICSLASAPVSPGLSTYLGVSAVCCAVTVAHGQASLRAKARVMEDARIEQMNVKQHYEEAYKE